MQKYGESKTTRIVITSLPERDIRNIRPLDFVEESVPYVEALLYFRVSSMDRLDVMQQM